MNDDVIFIGKPFITIENEKCRLNSVITINNQSKTLYYEVDRMYEPYLTYERSDPFVLSMLYYALINGYDIKWENPCTTQLIYQLSTFFIPTYVKEFSFMKSISLVGAVTSDDLPCANAVGTGFSNGVDSLYTIKKYTDSSTPAEFRLTHLISTDCFITNFNEAEKSAFYKLFSTELPKSANKLNLNYIFVSFHIDELFSIGVIKDSKLVYVADSGLFTLKYCSIAYALRKLFSVYYFSGGVSPHEFSFAKNDMAYHDLFTLPLISVYNLFFYSSGMEVSRLEKVKYIANWNYAQKNLLVCGHEKNCCNCSKCIRTLGELYAINKLELFKSVFDIDNFKVKIVKHFAYILMLAYVHKHIFEIEILDEMGKQNRKIPLLSYLLFILLSIKEVLRMRFRSNNLLRFIYFKFFTK